MTDRKDIADLIDAARKRVEAMSPDEREAMHQAQRESWVRGEMGMEDRTARFMKPTPPPALRSPSEAGAASAADRVRALADKEGHSVYIWPADAEALRALTAQLARAEAERDDWRKRFSEQSVQHLGAMEVAERKLWEAEERIADLTDRIEQLNVELMALETDGEP